MQTAAVLAANTWLLSPCPLATRDLAADAIRSPHSRLASALLEICRTNVSMQTRVQSFFSHVITVCAALSDGVCFCYAEYNK